MLTHLDPASSQAIGLLIFTFVLVIAFEASNGFHDTANAVATVIYTKSLPPVPAVIWSGLMNFLGCGLSDRNAGNLSFETWVRDLECVVEAADFRRFAMMGTCWGGAIAIEYAARHPEQVSQLESLTERILV